MGAGLQVAGAGLSAQGAKESQESNNMANEYNARITERNAQVAEIKADEAIRLGKIRGQKRATSGRAFAGAQRASFAASGVVVDNGSAMDVIRNTMDLSEQDALMERHNASKEAWSLRERAKGLRGQAELNRMRYRDPNDVFMTSLLTQGASIGGQQLARG